MAPDRSPDYLIALVDELRRLRGENGVVEFKENNGNPQEIGEYISALSNTAVLRDKATAYIVWGIRDGTHEVVGTSFQLDRAKKGAEDLIPWLTRGLSPEVPFHFHELEYEGRHVVLLEIPRAVGRPVAFYGDEYIRIGSYKKPLKAHPEYERALWRHFESTHFESTPVAERLSAQEVDELLNVPAYLTLLHYPEGDLDQAMRRMEADGVLAACDAGGWNITAMGAILFAKDLNQFDQLKRKAIRVIFYKGRDKLNTMWERVGSKGYAAGFEGLLTFLNDLLPRNEVIGQALRTDVSVYPPLAVRELVANALIHQDFSVGGAGPTIEVFEDRMEITNPGQPLMSTERFLDTAPRSRNEALASLMRRMGVCEERGSGIDKVVAQTEAYQLPAPVFETPEGATRAVLFAPKRFRDMDQADRIRACYLHACLRHVQREPMTNASLRARFGIEERNSAVASRIISDTMDAGFIKPYDPEQGKKYARYVPFWA